MHELLAPDIVEDDRLTLVGLLEEAYRGLEERFGDGLKACGALEAPAFELMLRLSRSPNGSLRMTDLAAQTRLTPSGLTRAVDRLVTAGLVRREACATDRRVTYVAVTDEGARRVRESVARHLDDVQTHLIDVLDPEERRQLEVILRKVRDHVRPDAAQVTPPVTSPD